MSEANEIYGQTYGRNIMQLAQQSKSKLINAVYLKPNVDGKTYYQDRIGEWSMALKAGRHSATPVSDPNLSRRMGSMLDYNDAVLLDVEDDIKIISDPKSAYTIAAAKAIGRRYDANIITAALGTSKAGEAGGTDVTLPTTQIIAEGSANLTFAKVREAKKKFDDADVEAEDRFFVTSPAGLESLLSIEQATSSDYNSVKALVRGEIDTWMGFKWITSTQLTVANDIRSCFAFQKYGLCLGKSKEAVIRTSEESTLCYAWQIYYSVHIGATRLEEERVVQVNIDETK